METKRVYFDNTYLFETDALIKASGQDEDGHYLLLDQTIFYPQGGGQPSDQGTLQGNNFLIPIRNVKSIDSEIRHYTDQQYSQWVGNEIKCIINQDVRLLHAKLHTAGHFIRGIIERHYPQLQAIKGHHFPRQCYIEFEAIYDSSTSIATEWINQEIKKLIQDDCLIEAIQVTSEQATMLSLDMPGIIQADQLARFIRIGEFPYDACGGTHIKSLKELNGLEVTQSKIKNARLKVKYHILSPQAES